MNKRLGISLIAILAAGPSAAQIPKRMSFEVASDKMEAVGEVIEQGTVNIYASGPIENGDADRFAAFAKEKRLDAARVVFNSPGGSLLEGVKLGRVIRALGFNTDIGAAKGSEVSDRAPICASACAYAFAGGVLRFISADGGKLGLHQFQTVTGPGFSESEAQTLSGFLVAYLSEMGVDPKAFALASVTEPDGIIWLGVREAEELGFANNGVQPTTADVKIVNMRPYLRLAQAKPGVELRVLILCTEGRLTLQAGIVTDPEQSRSMVDPQWLKRSYVEFDGKEGLALPGASGVHAQDSAVWLSRPLIQADARAMYGANDFGIWLDGFGIIRNGSTIDLRPVRPAIKNYVEQCYAR